MITFLIVAYIVIALAVYFVPALLGEDDGLGAVAIVWLPTLVVFLVILLISAPGAIFEWLYKKLYDWSRGRARRKLEQERLRKLEEAYRQQEIAKIVEKLPEVESNLVRVDEQYPELASQSPIDYRHMNCNSCGQHIDKDNEKD